MTQGDLLSINSVAAKLGLSVHQLRRWELMFGLEIKRGRGQQRQYRPEDLSVLERIKELVEQGWPTSQIRPQLEAEGLVTPKLIGLPPPPGNPEVLMEALIGFRNFTERRFIEISRQIDELRQLLISITLKQELESEPSSPWQPLQREFSPEPKHMPPQEISIGPEINIGTPVDFSMPAPAAPKAQAPAPPQPPQRPPEPLTSPYMYRASEMSGPAVSPGSTASPFSPQSDMLDDELTEDELLDQLEDELDDELDEELAQLDEEPVLPSPQQVETRSEVSISYEVEAALPAGEPSYLASQPEPPKEEPAEAVEPEPVAPPQPASPFSSGSWSGQQPPTPSPFRPQGEAESPFKPSPPASASSPFSIPAAPSYEAPSASSYQAAPPKPEAQPEPDFEAPPPPPAAVEAAPPSVESPSAISPFSAPQAVAAPPPQPAPPVPPSSPFSPAASPSPFSSPPPSPFRSGAQEAITPQTEPPQAPLAPPSMPAPPPPPPPAPLAPPPAPPAPPPAGAQASRGPMLGEITDQNYLTILGRALDLVGWSDEQADAFSSQRFGIPHWDELGRSQAEVLIDHLINELQNQMDRE